MVCLHHAKNPGSQSRTYVAKKRYQPHDVPAIQVEHTNIHRLEQALAQVHPSGIEFTLHFEPFQLFPDFPETADKQEWYLHEKHFDDEDAQKRYQEHMRSLAEPLGLKLSFDGQMGNTLQAHRVIQAIQEDKGPSVTAKLVDGLYRRYFAEGRHPSTDETLLEACVEAGVPDDEADALVKDHEKYQREVKQRIRNVTMDTDGVPVVVVEGRRRDITLTGAKEVADYVKALETVAKEST